MWTRLLTSHPWRSGSIGVLLLVCVMATYIFWPAETTTPLGRREFLRSELDLRDGILHVKGEDTPFNGSLIENYDKDSRKLEISIQNGNAHGLSRGWFEDGQLETEEHFVEGVSHGIRTRWYPNGKKKSETGIVDGQVSGLYVEWHDNGKKSAEATMVEGQPHGLVESFYPTGRLKSRVQLEHGVPVEKEYFEDTGPIAQVNKPATTTAP